MPFSLNHIESLEHDLPVKENLTRRISATARFIRLVLAAALTLMLTLSTAQSQLVPNLGGQRAGISSLQFLKIGVGARGAALGEAMVAVANDVSALYWNPAGLTQAEENAVMAAHAAWLVELQHDFVGAIYRLTPSDVIGLSVISLATDDMEITTETQPQGTGMYFRYRDLALGVSYARKLTDQFNFGATVRYVHEKLGVLKIETVLFDLGTYYWLGLGTARFGVAVSNFGSDVAPQGQVKGLGGTTIESFQSFSPPTMFKLGIAFDPLYDDQQKLTTTVQLSHPNDNAENVRMGLEYSWNKWLFLRAGLKRTIGSPLLGSDPKSADDYSYGLGVVAPAGITTVSFDYALTNFNQLGFVHRISFGFTY